ncbi:unnamed protein product [Orchesella dallaii]|uniref:Uncharacterized protein n=1 Tax=Orchesella dallaii TaxID=48710 RepID=A0ABP1R4Z5_9HEXA
MPGIGFCPREYLERDFYIVQTAGFQMPKNAVLKARFISEYFLVNGVFYKALMEFLKVFKIKLFDGPSFKSKVRFILPKWRKQNLAPPTLLYSRYSKLITDRIIKGTESFNPEEVKNEYINFINRFKPSSITSWSSTTYNLSHDKPTTPISSSQSKFTFPSGINKGNDKGNLVIERNSRSGKNRWSSSNIPVAREPRLNQGNSRNHHNNKPQGPPPPAQKPSHHRHHHHQQHKEGPPQPAHMRPDHRHLQRPVPAAQKSLREGEEPLDFKLRDISKDEQDEIDSLSTVKRNRRIRQIIRRRYPAIVKLLHVVLISSEMGVVQQVEEFDSALPGPSTSCSMNEREDCKRTCKQARISAPERVIQDRKSFCGNGGRLEFEECAPVALCRLGLRETKDVISAIIRSYYNASELTAEFHYDNEIRT